MAMKCCDMHGGLLRTPVTFQRVTKTTDAAGGFTDAWNTIAGAPVRAHVKAMSGSERYASDRVEATARYRVTVRYFAGLTEADAVSFAGKRHNIRFINNLEMRNLWLVIDVDGGVAPE
jgi:SPP1 family predicted phage head-tail adaptor